MVSLPPEIIDLIADELVHDFQVSDELQVTPTLTLRSYALVSRRHLVHSQKTLFAKIVLRPESKTPAQLARLLRNSPHLSTYIRKLKLSGIMMSDVSDDLSSILRATTNLSAFSVNVAKDESFVHLPEILKGTLLETFRLPTLASLNMEWIGDIPLRYILSCRQLKRFKHAGPYNFEDDSHEEDTSLIHPDSTTCVLDLLKLDCDPCARTII
ncbi:hypothetical protein C0991_006159, partial [Blastosporella zonata]